MARRQLPEPIDWSKFFGPDEPSGEPKFEQIQDPFTGDIVCPGLRVDTNGNVIRSGHDVPPSPLA